MVEPSEDQPGTMIAIFEEMITKLISDREDWYTRLYFSTNKMWVKLLFWFSGIGLALILVALSLGSSR